MKRYVILLLAGIPLLLTHYAKAQCSSGTTQQITYDTTVYTAGDGSHSYTFPQFDPSAGTLTSVTVTEVVNMGYSFSLHNRNNTSSSTVKVWPGRVDDIYGGPLSTDIYKDTTIHYGPYTLAPNDNVDNSGPDDTTVGPLQMLKNYVVSDTDSTDVVPFMGTGDFTLQHDINNTVTLLGGITVDYSASANDTIHLSLTYTYCDLGTLPADIISFTAVKNDHNEVDIRWLTENEPADRRYELEFSRDGRNYTTIDKRPAQPNDAGQGNYYYQYSINPSDPPTLYFRLREVESNGDIKYSPVRTVAWKKEETSQPVVYPNPANDYVHIDFNQPRKQNWQVDIISATGALIQRNACQLAGFADIRFKTTLQNGVYFIRAVSLDSRETFTLPFSVRH